VAPRVLVVQGGPGVDGVERAVAADGLEALTLAAREVFDVVVVDCTLPALDGWFLLAAIGAWDRRPRLVATVHAAADAARARSLGADVCVAAGTSRQARALQAACRPHRETSSRRPTTSGGRA
jgi:CheY-like chemotaxis protein